jgi:probable HAF family extracellular repeat protein
MRKLRIGIALITIATATVAAGPAAPAAAVAPRLHIVDLGTLGGACCSQATAVNDRGEVVGDTSVGPDMFTSHAFLWRNGRMIDLGTLGGNGSTAADINTRGDVVGASDPSGGPAHATLWRGGRIIDLGTLGGDTSYDTAISDAGEVVGFSTTADSFGMHAFSWRAGVMTDLGTLNGGFARAYDVNNRGQVVGDSSVDGMNSVPMQWWRGAPAALTARFGQASAINDSGQITGFYFDGTGSFVCSHGQFVDIARPAGATFLQSQGINNRGDVVGITDFNAFLWQRGQLTALPRLAGASSGANDINDRGQIAGFSATNPDGTNPHAVLWTD